jgi:hypothetical protein
MLQYISVCFQWFALAPGSSVRHTCDMGYRDSFDVKWTWSFTVPIGERQSRPLFMATVNGRRSAGKPFPAARLRRDRIVAYVRHLQQTEPSLIKVLVAKAAAFYGVDGKTVRNALREDRKLGPGGIIDLGPISMRYGQTVDLRPK